MAYAEQAEEYLSISVIILSKWQLLPTGDKVNMQIYDVPMTFVNKLIHGGQCNFVIDLFLTVNTANNIT